MYTMRKITALLSTLALLISCVEDNLLKPYGNNDGKAPSNITAPHVKSLPEVLSYITPGHRPRPCICESALHIDHG